jgi:NAD(P)-dependent dehydrogenase (short-subunit alcohol dehydrogenase family)
MSSDSFLQGKVSVVTGGTRGIGRAIAESLLDAGSRVAICGRTKASVDRAVAELQERPGTAPGSVAGQSADVGDSTALTGFFEFVDTEFGGVDILVNNAGIGIFRSVADLRIEEWDATLRTNLSGVFYASREALARFRKRGGGYIINIGSLAGKNPFAGGSAYNASKFGLNGFSEAMMLDHRQDNVRVSYIMPGSVDTEFGSQGTGASWKIAPEDVAEITMLLLRMPARTLVSRVEVRPARPKK